MLSGAESSLPEPTVVKVHLLRTKKYSISRVATTFKSVTSTATDSAMVTMRTDPPASVPTMTGIPTLPAEFDAPVATESIPAIAALALVAIVLCALILLFALLYFIILRFRGKCPNCPRYEDEIKKWKHGELQAIKTDMVQERMRSWDLEKGAMDLQAHMYVDRMRMQSLAHLEGARSGGDFPVETAPREMIPTHVVTTVTRLGEPAEATLVEPELPKTHSVYLKEVVGPRQAAAGRLLEEAQAQALNRHLEVVCDPVNRESVQQRAVNRANELIAERAAKNDVPAPPKGGESCFK
ncbi:hypothetical protein SVAN01_09447 [Stagonosporopsis vannaccii]|nr:hypothetical protein SVAN01_09447 [Stagonosporopsis vannaccii]